MFGIDFSLLGELAIAGVPTGCVAALSGIGLVLTYQATGVFNFAHGAVAMFVAYIVWQLNVQNDVSLWIAAPVGILVVGPLMGILLERLVFRSLQRSGASTSEKLVATLGVFVLLVGTAFAIWTGESRTDAPRLFPIKPLTDRFDIAIGVDDAWLIGIVAAACAALYVLFRRTHFGTQIRAVVDKRELAELSAVNANRVAAVAWALGCGFAGLSGVLLAPSGKLDPYRLTLLVIDTFAVAVIARLHSIPAAALAGLALGVFQSTFNYLVTEILNIDQLSEPWSAIPTNLLVIALLVALLVLRNLDESGEESTGRGLVTGSIGAQTQLTPPKVAVALILGLATVVAPLLLPTSAIVDSQRVLGLFVVFLSIVVITGFSGHISLGQAGFAGLGAYLTARLSAGQFPSPFPKMPVLVAMLVALLVVLPVGLATGYPALRRRGLILGLTTLAVGLLIFRFVFEQLLFVRHGVNVFRPNLFGVSLDGEKAFYWFCLGCAGLMLLLARNLRSGRLGRILAAMRDSEVGARSVGINLRRYKLFIFAISSMMAGLGGMLLAQQSRSFDSLDFDPFTSLIWFTAVVVAGLSYLSGAAVAAVLIVVLDALLGRAGVSTGVIGLLALFLGRLPGGLVGSLRRLALRDVAHGGLQRRYSEVQAEVAATPKDSTLVPTEFADRIRAEAGR